MQTDIVEKPLPSPPSPPSSQLSMSTTHSLSQLDYAVNILRTWNWKKNQFRILIAKLSVIVCVCCATNSLFEVILFINVAQYSLQLHTPRPYNQHLAVAFYIYSILCAIGCHPISQQWNRLNEIKFIDKWMIFCAGARSLLRSHWLQYSLTQLSSECSHLYRTSIRHDVPIHPSTFPQQSWNNFGLTRSELIKFVLTHKTVSHCIQFSMWMR